MTREKSWWLTTPFIRLFSLSLVGFLVQFSAFIMEVAASFTIISTMGWNYRLQVTQFIPVLIFSIGIWIFAFVFTSVALTPSRAEKPEIRDAKRVRMTKTGCALFLYFLIRWSILVLSVWSGYQTAIYLAVCLDLIMVGLFALGWCFTASVRVCPGECVKCCGMCDEELASLKS